MLIAQREELMAQLAEQQALAARLHAMRDQYSAVAAEAGTGEEPGDGTGDGDDDEGAEVDAAAAEGLMESKDGCECAVSPRR